MTVSELGWVGVWADGVMGRGGLSGVLFKVRRSFHDDHQPALLRPLTYIGRCMECGISGRDKDGIGMGMRPFPPSVSKPSD